MSPALEEDVGTKTLDELEDELKSLVEAHTNKHAELQHKIQDIEALIAANPKFKEVIDGLISEHKFLRLTIVLLRTGCHDVMLLLKKGLPAK